jgi:hypothetical protein
MPLGKNASDPNNGGESFRNGTPLTTPHEFGNPMTHGNDSTQFGNSVPTSGTEQNVINRPINPAEFGTIISG